MRHKLTLGKRCSGFEPAQYRFAFRIAVLEHGLQYRRSAKLPSHRAKLCVPPIGMQMLERKLVHNEEL